MSLLKLDTISVWWREIVCLRDIHVGVTVSY